uniref:FH2 domain-containing protein n=1 Tax=Strongyloides papillosus TaxID=174720 RepID=A0A0N5BUG3_STREA
MVILETLHCSIQANMALNLKEFQDSDVMVITLEILYRSIQANMALNLKEFQDSDANMALNLKEFQDSDGYFFVKHIEDAYEEKNMKLEDMGKLFKSPACMT